MRPYLTVTLPVLLACLWAGPAPGQAKMLTTGGSVGLADLIVRGEIVRVEERPVGKRPFRVGVIGVADVIYGPPTLRTARLVLQTGNSEGRAFAVGDSGTFFLRRFKDPDVTRVQRQDSLLRIADRDGGTLGMEVELFDADDPNLFWPDGAATAFKKRHGEGPDPTTQAVLDRERAMLNSVRVRLARDEADLERRLASNRANQAKLGAIRMGATRPAAAHSDSPSAPRH